MVSPRPQAAETLAGWRTDKVAIDRRDRSDDRNIGDVQAKSSAMEGIDSVKANAPTARVDDETGE
jgi:hypothetical protein